MNLTRMSLLCLATCLLASCAASVPTELANARSAYRRASMGEAAKLAPAELHVANTALYKAEMSFAAEDDLYKTKDLAYVAQRKAQLAEAIASITAEQGTTTTAKEDYETTQGKIVSKTKDKLDRTQDALAESKLSGELTAEQLALEQEARLAAEKRATEAILALAKLESVKDEPRGMVITLSGSVLFTSAKWTLSSGAQSRLSAVSAVLLESPGRSLRIEGHTDSQGSDDDNIELSQHRADAVRNYLVQQGYSAALISAVGKGESSPVGENDSTEGRANNRRVEIIIERELTSATR